MKAVINICALAFAHLLCAARAEGQTIDIPIGPDIYGNSAVYVHGALEGFGQDAQSFIATGAQLTSVSTPMYEQRTDQPLFWQYQLWDDVGGHPNQVIATFGSFNPTLSLSNFTVTLATPVPLIVGHRYYLGFAPDPAKVPNNPYYDESNFVVPGWRTTSTQDAYSDGTVWAIRNPGSAGEVIVQPTAFDYSMRISMVPEPSTALLLVVGACAIFRMASRHRARPERPFSIA